jgi:membrane fusion protein (multidrug efflux system)
MSRPVRALRRSALLAALFVPALLAGCKEDKPQGAGAGGPPGKPEVSVVTLKAQRVAITTELPGRSTAFRVAEVRPQVNGLIQKLTFTEGQQVQADQVLYQIDPAPYQASLASAQAAVAKAQATVTSSQATVNRYRPLARASAISGQDLDNAVATLRQAEADVASAKASVMTASINLAYTRLTSPITGRSGRTSVTEGALVTANQTTSLVTVTQLDPIYVDVTQPTSTLLRLKRELAAGSLTPAGDNQAAVNLVLEDGTEYDQPGKLQFSEVTVDQGTGSVTLRAIFPNPNGTLLPGMFVREQIEEGVRDNALLVPQRGVTRNQRGEPTALVVGKDDKVEVRVLTTDRAVGDAWLVTQGLAAGDRVIIEGLQKVKPGVQVTAKEMPAPTKQADASGPPAGTAATVR